MLQISGGDIITLPMELELLHGILASARTRAQHRTSGDPADMAAMFECFEWRLLHLMKVTIFPC